MKKTETKKKVGKTGIRQEIGRMPFEEFVKRILRVPARKTKK